MQPGRKRGWEMRPGGEKVGWPPAHSTVRKHGGGAPRFWVLQSTARPRGSETAAVLEEEFSPQRPPRESDGPTESEYPVSWVRQLDGTGRF